MIPRLSSSSLLLFWWPSHTTRDTRWMYHSFDWHETGLTLFPWLFAWCFYGSQISRSDSSRLFIDKYKILITSRSASNPKPSPPFVSTRRMRISISLGWLQLQLLSSFLLITLFGFNFVSGKCYSSPWPATSIVSEIRNPILLELLSLLFAGCSTNSLIG